MQINYDEMLAAYNKNIETNLRGFSGGAPPFEIWVPYDGDHDRSIGALFEIGREAGNEVIYIHTSLEAGDQVQLGGYKDGFITRTQEGVEFISQRAAAALHQINSLAKSLGYEQKISIVGLKKNILTIDYDDKGHAKPLHEALIKIEGHLNETLGARFDIQTLNVDDRNRRKCGPR